MSKDVSYKIIAAIGLAAGLSIAAGAATAATVSFSPLGPLTPAGESLITNFDTAPAGLSGTNYNLLTGTSGIGAEPYLSSGPDLTQYLSVLGGGSATLALGGNYKHVSVYIGSLDNYNTISFSDGSSFTGTSLATGTGAAVGGSQSSSLSNGLFSFQFATGVSSVSFASTSNSFEISAVSGGVPEASTWIMMLLGFCGLGFAGYRASNKTAPLQA